jgi:hypothetical protein
MYERKNKNFFSRFNGYVVVHVDNFYPCRVGNNASKFGTTVFDNSTTHLFDNSPTLRGFCDINLSRGQHILHDYDNRRVYDIRLNGLSATTT